MCLIILHGFQATLNVYNIISIITWFEATKNVHNTFYYININEVPGKLSRENLISSHVKISPLLWLQYKSCLSHLKTIKGKWFGSSLVFT